MIKFIKRHYVAIDFIILTLILLCVYLMYNATLNLKNKTVLMGINDIAYGHVILTNITPTKETTIKKFIENNDKDLEYIANTFQIDKQFLIDEIYMKNDNDNTFNELDVFQTNNVYTNTLQSINDYLLNLERTNPELFNNEYKYDISNEEYILGVIDYYTAIYDNVDPVIAKAIGLVESGYSSQTMLSKNNIYGGMGYNGLIRYKNIDYGVMRYIELLSTNYFGQGLTSVEDICFKYNPVNINGVKNINYTWVNNVYKAMEKYTNI